MQNNNWKMHLYMIMLWLRGNRKIKFVYGKSG